MSFVLPTAAQAAPSAQVLATWVTGVTATSANLHAEADTEGLPSTYRFEYLTEAAYESNLGAGDDGFTGAGTAPVSGEAGLGTEAGAQSVQQRIEHLTPETSYRYRVLFNAGAGPTPGPARTLTTQPIVSGSPEGCANAQLRTEDASTALPDCRAWEMVSPLDKNGGAIQGFGANFGGDVLQAAAGGGAVTYSSRASFAVDAQGAPPASQYLSRRTASGWSTENITGPARSAAYGANPDGVPYQLFSPDLARGLLLDGARCGEAELCPRGYALRESSDGTLTSSAVEPDLRFAGASSDLRHVVLSTCAALTEGATEVPGVGGNCDPADANLYAWSGGQLQLINDLSGGLAGPFASLHGSNAVSGDGSRIYWNQIDSVLFLHEGDSNWQLAENAEFQTATPDGRIAFYIENEHLYSYDAETHQSTYYFLAPIAEGAGFGGLLGLVGVSDDGSYIYYVGGNGDLYLHHDGEDTNIASAVETSDYPPATGTARVSSDGAQLAFLSKASLTGYDNTDANTGLLDTEVYLYDAASNQLTCASCNPTGERPLGPSSIPGAIANGKASTATDSYKPRVLSADGQRLFFDSSDRLLPRDGSAAQDVYEWEAPGRGGCQQPKGCVFLISSGHSAEPSEFIDASADGADAFFLTADSLDASDPGSVDLYDARELGGLPLAPSGIPCEGDACQPLPSPPEDPSPGTLVPGSANPPIHYSKPGGHHHKKGHHKRRKHRGKRHPRGGSR